MWKRGYFWAGIIGAVVFVLGAAGIVGAVSQPSDLFWVNAANVVQYVLYIALAIFLMAIFLMGRGKEDAGHTRAKPEPDSSEDKASLHRKRNLIFAFLILFGIIADSQNWVTNNYAAGLTLVNAAVIFDLVFNLLFLYIAVQLFRDKRSIEKVLLYAIIVYAVVEAIMTGMLGTWGEAIYNLIYGAYFAYALLSPINRKHFRIAQYIVLPVVMVFGLFCASLLDNYHLIQLQKNHGLVDQTYGEDNSQFANDYSLFIQANPPTATDIQNVENDASTTSQALQQDVSALDAINAIYKARVPDISQQLAIEQINKTVAIAAVYQQQINLVEQLMAYVSTVDLRAPSTSQAAKINAMEQQINALGKQASDLAYKLENNE